MTTTLFREDIERTVRRTNLHPDPRFIGPDSVFISGAGAVDQEDVASGAPDGRGYTIFTVTTTIESRLDVAVATEDRIAVTPGNMYAASAYNNWSGAGGSATPTTQVVIVWYNSAGGVVGQSDGTPSTVVAGSQGWGRPSVAAVAPAGAAYGQPRVRFLAGSGGIVAGVRLRVAQRLYELGGWIGEYFDGGSFDPTGLLTYEWEGAENASPSHELGPVYSITPTLVINYAQDRPTGVMTFDTILGGAPVVVRLPSRRTARGTLEMYCATEGEAHAVADVCDGRTNVVLVSDDLPEVPFTFTPTDNVRVAWNSPYKSWTTSVPYVKVSY